MTLTLDQAIAALIFGRIVRCWYPDAPIVDREISGSMYNADVVDILRTHPRLLHQGRDVDIGDRASEISFSHALELLDPLATLFRGEFLMWHSAVTGGRFIGTRIIRFSPTRSECYCDILPHPLPTWTRRPVARLAWALGSPISSQFQGLIRLYHETIPKRVALRTYYNEGWRSRSVTAPSHKQ